MQMQSRSRFHSMRCPRAATPRHFQPRVEPLERRLLLDADPLLFIENFSLDTDPTQPGYDQADNDPATPLDRLLIQHSISARGASFFPTTIVGTGSTFQPSEPYALGLLGPGGDTISLPPVGTPGGLAAGEEITAVAIGYSGFGALRFYGNNGVKTINFFEPENVWRTVTVTANSPSDTGQELGAIQYIFVSTFEVAYIDDIALLVNGIIVNNPPVANLDAATTLPGTQVEIDALANDGDADGDQVSLFTYIQPPNGSVIFHDGKFVYTPDPGFHGIDTFEYRITDGRIPAGSEVPGTVQITVNTPPPAPIVNIPVPHGFTGPITFDASALLAGVVDADGDPLAIVSFESPLLGASLTHNADGTFTYVPNPLDGLVPSDQFEFRLGDGYSVGDKGVALLDPNQYPISLDSDFRGTLSHADRIRPITGGLGFDPEGDPIWPVLDREPIAGTVRFQGGGSEPWTFMYEPEPGNYPQRAGNVEDSFTFHLVDVYGSGNVGTVLLAWPNTLPRAANDEITLELNPANLPPGGEVFISVVTEDGILSNDVDLDGDEIFGARIVRQPTYGSARFFDGQTLVYQSFDFQEGREDSFSYVVTDSLGESNEATVNLRINMVPLIGYDSYTVVHNIANQPPSRVLSVSAEDGLFDNDFDAAGNQATLARAETEVSIGPLFDPQAVLHNVGDTVTVELEHGRLDFHGDGSFDYTPDPGFIGTERFSYHWDWSSPSESGSGRVEIDVTNRPPVAVPGGPYTIIEGQTVVLDGSASYDPDGDPLEFRWSGPIYQIVTGATPTVTWDNTAERSIYPLTLVLSDSFETVFSETPFTIIADGVLDDQEDDGPNGGDANYDGIPDRLQPNVVNFGRATLVSPAGTYLTDIHNDARFPPSTLPGVTLFYLGFTIGALAHGQPSVVSLIFESPTYANSYGKYGPRPDDPGTPANESFPQWYEFLYDGSTGARFYDINGQEVDPYDHVSLSRIDLHFIDGQRGDSDLTANGQIVDPGGPLLVDTFPHVESIVINDGHLQRSRVNSLTVAFDSLVTIERGAFELQRQGTKKPVDLNISLNESNGRTVALLTFRGPAVQHGSLKDGSYTLTIRGDKIRDAAGRLLDGDADGEAGGDYVDEFFRLFGDTDGDGDVDNVDKQTFKSAYGKRSSQPGYLWYLDFNANGRIWAEDGALFLLGYCRSNPHKR